MDKAAHDQALKDAAAGRAPPALDKMSPKARESYLDNYKPK